MPQYTFERLRPECEALWERIITDRGLLTVAPSPEPSFGVSQMPERCRKPVLAKELKAAEEA